MPSIRVEGQPGPEHRYLVRHYAYLARPLDSVSDLLAADPAAVIGSVGADSAVTSPLRARLGGISVSRSARLRIGAVTRGPVSTRVPLRWEDARYPRLFPVLDAELTFEKVPSSRRPILQVGLVGRYSPPLGTFGGLANWVYGDEIAGEVVGGFVHDVAQRLESLLPEAPSTPEPDRPLPPDGPAGEDGNGTRRTRRILIPVDGLGARQGGALAIERKLAATEGVVHCEVDPLTQLAAIEYDQTRCRLDDLLDQLTR